MPDDRIQVELGDGEVILTCKEAKKADQGKYSVTLKNSKGSDTAKVNVSVLGKHDLIQQNLSTTHFDSFPSFCIYSYC